MFLSTTTRATRCIKHGGWPVFFITLALCLSGTTHARAAEPFVPASDATVLERLPAAAELQQLAPLRRALEAQPSNLRLALRLARAYIKLSRETADPRYLGYAESVLEPWPDGPAPVWVLRATMAQSRHRFDRALALLDKALAAAPGNLQAWLTRATILQVRGDIAGALAACQHLKSRAPPLVFAVCHNSARALSGELKRAYERLLAVLARNRGAKPAIQVWALTALGEMAVRFGQPQAGEQHFRRALALDPDDVYLLAAHADLLLARGDSEAVINLLRGHESQDVLLLRLALAAGDSPAGQRWRRMLSARFEAAAQRGLTTHRREHARFALDALHDPDRALQLAQANWQVQHEPDDIRILLRAAQAADRPEAAQPARAWMRAHDYQDARIADLRNQRAKAAAR